MRRYECVVILDSDMKDDDIQGFTQQYAQLIKDHGGETIKIEDWGTKRLAYLVKKKEKGRYVMFDYVGTPALISEIERRMKISDDVLKFLSVKLDGDVDLEAFRAAELAKKEAAQAKAEEEAAAAAAAMAPPVAAEDTPPAPNQTEADSSTDASPAVESSEPPQVPSVPEETKIDPPKEVS
jgi:small subunit ribosomal protein S6